MHTYEGLPPHPKTLPRDDRELYEAMVLEHLRRVEPTLEARAAQLADAHEVRPWFRVVPGDSAKVLSEVAEAGDKPSLVVISSRELGTSERMLLGSLSTRVLMAASGPVLVCPRGAPNGA